MNSQPSYRLNNLLDKLLPGWQQVLGCRWTASDLLQMSDHIADKAFLNVVSMYQWMLKDRFPPHVFEWWPTEWLKAYRARNGKVAECKNKGTTTHAKKSSVHGLGCQPLVTGGKSLPSNHAAAQRELAAMRRQHRAKEDMGGQPRDTDGRSLPSDAAKDKQPRIGELRAKHARGCPPMASATENMPIDAKWTADYNGTSGCIKL